MPWFLFSRDACQTSFLRNKTIFLIMVGAFLMSKMFHQRQFGLFH
jgi:hypothetical protein